MSSLAAFTESLAEWFELFFKFSGKLYSINNFSQEHEEYLLLTVIVFIAIVALTKKPGLPAVVKRSLAIWVLTEPYPTAGELQGSIKFEKYGIDFYGGKKLL